MLKRFAYLLLAVALIGLGFGVTSCTNAPTKLGVTEGVAANPGVLFGKVVDSQTHRGIAGATVYLKVAGQWRSTVTMSATTGGAEDEIGNYTMSDLPVDNSQMNMVVKGPQGSNYLTYRDDTVYIASASNNNAVASPNTQVSEQYDVSMDTGVTAAVYVVDSSTGNYVVKSDGSALTLYTDLSWGSNGDSVTWDYATQDTTDTNKYTFVISEMDGGCVYFPAQDVNGDGVFDYYGNDTCIDDAHAANLVTNMAVDPATNYIAPYVVAGNLNQAGQNSGGNPLTVMGKGDSLRMFFNEPVELATSGNSVRLYYWDYMKALSNWSVQAEVSATVALSADSTLLTITPAAALTENLTYELDAASVSLRAKADPNWPVWNDTVYALNDIVGGAYASIYVYATGAGTIGSSPVITLDNGNYCTNGAKINSMESIANCATGGNAGNVRLLFPENVWGSVSLVSDQSGTTTVNYDNVAPVKITGQDYMSYLVSQPSGSATGGNSYYDNTIGYNASGAQFIFDLSNELCNNYWWWCGFTMPDSITGTVQSLKLEINAYDAEGNVFHTVADYAVQ